MLPMIAARGGWCVSFLLASVFLGTRPSCNDCDLDDSCGCSSSNAPYTAPPQQQPATSSSVVCEGWPDTLGGAAAGEPCAVAMTCAPAHCPSQAFTSSWYASACVDGKCDPNDACQLTQLDAEGMCFADDFDARPWEPAEASE
jgi:hypothetical protein